MPISLDVSNMLSEHIGDQGLGRDQLNEILSRIDDYKDRVTATPFPFMRLPETKFQFSEMNELAVAARQKGIKNVVLLGIGGSALGAQTIFEALLRPFHNLDRSFRGDIPRYFVVDNIDPDKINAIIEIIRPELADTLLLVISKSGETPETISQFMIFKELMMGSPHANSRIILITDKEKGILNTIAREEGYTTLTVPDGVGGRFSVLTPVGIFPSLLMNIPVDQILDGAQAMLSHVSEQRGTQNMASVLAAVLYGMYINGKNINVLMPYCERLSAFADWFRQLEGESLGKEGKGITPTKSIGVTDQHSQLQLYVQGPRDKCVMLFYSATAKRRIPNSFPYVEDIAFYADKDLNDLFRAEFNATRLSLTEAGSPNLTFLIDEITPFTLGALFSLFEMTIVYLGDLLQVNAFDQPGVEQGKIYTKALMGKQGLEAERSRIQSLSSRPKTTVTF